MKRIAFYLSLVLVVLVLASCKKGQKTYLLRLPAEDLTKCWWW